MKDFIRISRCVFVKTTSVIRIFFIETDKGIESAEVFHTSGSAIARKEYAQAIWEELNGKEFHETL